MQTAWRTPGDGRGQWVTLIFDNPIDVVRIGLIPGYAKTDPQMGANRFLQDRIIKAVVYQIPGLPNTPQTFEPLPVPQFVPLRATTSQITVKSSPRRRRAASTTRRSLETYVYGYPQ